MFLTFIIRINVHKHQISFIIGMISEACTHVLRQATTCETLTVHTRNSGQKDSLVNNHSHVTIYTLIPPICPFSYFLQVNNADIKNDL